jgi:branched-chain amino acid aminotransferase
MKEAIFNKFIFNDNVYKVDNFEEIYGENSPSVYEVIRIFKSVPLFLEEHYVRLLNSSRLLGYSIDISFEEIKKTISRMIYLNNITNCNIKIVINSFEEVNKNLYVFFVKSSYPKDSLYLLGIETFVYKATRENPNAKVIYKSMRDDINRLLEEKNCYEAILLNEREEITEGSRSNLFFIKNNTVYTAPRNSVLIGITRDKILELCKKDNINFVEKVIHLNELNSFNAAFISGTSPKILPIKKIDGNSYQCNDKLLKRLIDIYNLEIENYVSNCNNH